METITAEKKTQKQINGHAHSVTRNLNNALDYLELILKIALDNNLKSKDAPKEYPLFEFEDNGDPLFQLTTACQFSFDEFIILLLALAPHIRPNLLDSVIEKYISKNTEFPEIGGKKSGDVRYMMPTGDTALFVLSGYDLEKRLKIQALFDEHSYLAKEQIVKLETVDASLPKMSGKLMVDPDIIDLLTKGYVELPKYSSNFPAQHITTSLEWGDLVLAPHVKEQITEIKDWIDHHDRLYSEWGMENKLRPGYLALLHGPPGTGKTLAASLLGKYTGCPVFRIELSSIVSKYIGDTEKNLANLFDKAEHKNWILVFEEADSIFGKRTSVTSAHDRYANQEISYLLQRIETYSGLCILTSNFKGNMDDAFLRRFNAIVEFPFPNKEERREIWDNTFPDHISLEDSERFLNMVSDQELAGGNIINIVQFSCLKALKDNRTEIRLDDVRNGIKYEFEKMGKVYQEI